MAAKFITFALLIAAAIAMATGQPKDGNPNIKDDMDNPSHPRKIYEECEPRQVYDPKADACVDLDAAATELVDSGLSKKVPLSRHRRDVIDKMVDKFSDAVYDFLCGEGYTHLYGKVCIKTSVLIGLVAGIGVPVVILILVCLIRKACC